MRLDKNTCLGGRLNGKDILGIKCNGYVIYPMGSEEPGVPESPTLYQPYEFKDEEYITGVDTLVNSYHTDLSYMFSGCNRLRVIYNIDTWDTSNVTNMMYMFYSCYGLTSPALKGIEDWDVSNVRSMSYMFCFCESLSTLDLSKWDTSNVTSMSHMFMQCQPASGGEGLTELNLRGWNTSKVTNMYNAFNSGGLHVLDIRDFDMTNVTNTDYMIPMGNRLHTLRLDNCSYDSIKKIIESKGFPSIEQYQGLTRKIYVNPNYVGDLTPPTNWVFVNCLTNEIIK